jgi:uncharacterized membrane protein YbaN (DUF454 family)
MQETNTAKIHKVVRRGAVIGFGLTLVLGGIAGLFLPVVPGALLLVAGAVILRPQSAWLRRFLDECHVRFPALERVLQRLSKWSETPKQGSVADCEMHKVQHSNSA